MSVKVFQIAYLFFLSMKCQGASRYSCNNWVKHSTIALTIYGFFSSARSPHLVIRHPPAPTGRDRGSPRLPEVIKKKIFYLTSRKLYCYLAAWLFPNRY